ncbi:Cytochrome P450 3A4 [Entophlyctis sp. JEL0112]|nr:Cytochrome P450 3A4 [Entophlyctis sp. JEL0112]
MTIETTWLGVATSLAVVVSVSILSLAASYAVISSRKRKGSDPPIAPYHLPVIGHVLVIAKGSLVFAEKLFEGIGEDVVEVWLQSQRVYLIRGTEFTRQILMDASINCRWGPVEGLKELGEYKAGILFNDDIELWKANRKCLVETISRPRFLKSLGTKINPLMQSLCTCLGELADLNVPILINQLFGCISLDVILDVTLSMKPVSAEGYVLSCIERKVHDNHILSVIRATFKSAEFFIVIPHLLFKYVPTLRAEAKKHLMAMKTWTDITRNLLSDRYDELKGAPTASTEDMATAFILNSKDNWDLERATNTLRTAISAGTETSSNAMSFFVFEIARHPSIADAIFEEIRTTLDSTETGKLTDVDVAQLKLLRACISETLRLYAVLPVINRRLDKDLQLGEFVLKKNSVLLLQVQSAHTMESLWDNPLEFKPERFMNGSQTLGGPYNLGFSYTPFGYGPRKCPGEALAMMEMAIVLMHLCFNFKFELASPLQRAPIKETLTLECQDVPVKFIRRNTK